MLHRLRDVLFGRPDKRPDQATIDAVRAILEEQALAEDEAIHYTELGARHIQNLRVVTDRNALLELLPKNAVVSEIGVAAGEFSAQILAITNPKKLHLIDSWAHDERYENFQDQIAAMFAAQIAVGQVVIQRGLTITELAKFPDAYFDWVYVDSSHDYESTSQELELCRAKVKAGGLIAGHDYVTGHWPGWYRYGVIEAVNAFCVKYGWEMIYLTHEAHRHLSYALRSLPQENP